MSGIPSYVPCHNCEQDHSAPTDPYEEESDCLDCNSNKGRFFDRITHAFVMPGDGSEAKLYVCQPDLWAACQWIGMCTSNGGVAALKITGISLADKSLTVYNGCQGQKIATNPPGGTTFDTNTVIYPINSQCNSLGESALAELQTSINNLSGICLGKIPEADGDIEFHAIMAATFGEGSTPLSDPQFWEFCLRKFKQAYWGDFGRSLCFNNLPSTTDASVVIDSVTYPKRFVYFDTFKKCLRQGPAVGDASFCNAVTLEPDGESNYFFDKVVVCDGNNRKAIEPKEGFGLVGVKGDDDVERWAFKLLNQGDTYLDSFEDLVVLANIASGTYNYEYTPAEDRPSWANYAICELTITMTGTSGTGAMVASSPKGPSDQYVTQMRLYNNAGINNALAGEIKLKIFDTTNKIKLRLVISGTGGTRQYGLKHVGWSS